MPKQGVGYHFKIDMRHRLEFEHIPNTTYRLPALWCTCKQHPDGTCFDCPYKDCIDTTYLEQKE